MDSISIKFNILIIISKIFGSILFIINVRFSICKFKFSKTVRSIFDSIIN